MTRFPLDLPQAPEAERFSEAEERALVQLAEELRGACPDPAVSDGFAEEVRERMQRPWTVWRTLERSSFARTAATLMVIVVGVAPVVALARMLPWFRTDPPPIGFILPRNEPVIDDAPITRPQPDPPAEAAQATADVAVQRDRLLRAAASWRAAGPGKPAAPSAVRIPSWASASAEDLWLEFVRRCALGEADPVPDALAARVRALALQSTEEERRPLAPWLWVLGGDPFPLRDARPSHAWAGAPWLSGR